MLAVSSWEPALPTVIGKMEKTVARRRWWAGQLTTGYAFNTDGTSIYMTLAALFVAQASNTPLTLGSNS